MTTAGILAFALLICTTSASYAKSPSSPESYLFKIGETQAVVRSSAGMPQMLYSTATRKYYDDSEEDILMQLDGKIVDIYERPSSGNTFRISVWYNPDPSFSRLHPAERVTRIDFTPDHAAPFRVLMNEIPEVVALCKDGCAMGGIVSGTIPEIHACRTPKFPNELAIMTSAASGWLPNNNQEFVYEYCVRVTFEESSSSYQLAPGQTWDNLTVNQIEIGPGLDPRTDKLVAMGVEKEYDLGIWTPE